MTAIMLLTVPRSMPKSMVLLFAMPIRPDRPLSLEPLDSGSWVVHSPDTSEGYAVANRLVIPQRGELTRG